MNVSTPGQPEEEPDQNPEENDEIREEVDVFQSGELAEIDRRGREALEAENAPAYRPDQSDSGHPPMIVFQVSDISLNVSTASGYTCPAVLTAATTTGQVYSIWAWAQALQSQLRKERPQVGDIAAVAYKGKRVSTQRVGTEYHDWRFKVLRDRSQASIDWNSVALAGGGEEDPFAEPEKKVEKEEPSEPEGKSSGGGTPPDDIPFAPVF